MNENGTSVSGCSTEWWEDEERDDVKEREGVREEGTRLAAVAREGRSGSVAGSTRPRGGGER